MKDGDGFDGASYLREYTRDEDNNIHVHAGLVPDPKIRKWLSWVAERYQPLTDEMPARFWETRFAKEALAKYGTETAQYALEEGQMHVIDYLTGMPDTKVDMSTMDALDWLGDWVSRDAPITLVSGHMNTGKSSTTLKIYGKLWQDEHPRGTVLSNIRTCPATESCSRMSTLVEYARDHKDEPTMMILDEAAAHASGDLDDYEVKEQMRQLIRFAAKYDLGLTIIGHAEGGRDISPEIRRFAEVIHKTSKKRATIYENITEKKEYVDKKYELKALPDVTSKWKYDPDETSTWKWDYDGDDLVDLDNDVDELDWGEGTDEEPEWESCQGVRQDGEACQQDNPAALDENGYCRHHTDQYEPDEEDED
ncbi:hypothetical protein [Natronococcus occultus]|uniref:Uncharacterized protein n=1 Tax=Natronococcus occultus SP4 TaxID=694430 RepID=L0K1S3_9EURY|nr:hypothetical protein [Natronococcus occultus]AGB38068.1 hypothetical protein Natoc_2290 [Natronococcus occultus SP4]